MAITTGIGLLIGAVGAIDGFVQGRSMSNEALRGLEAFERQTLINNYEGLTPSLEAERTALDTFNQSESNVLDVAQGMDFANAQGLVSNASEQTNKQRLAMFDTMRKEVAQIDFAAAADEGKIRGMVENRDQYELESLREQLAAGQQMKYDSISGLAKGFMSVGLAKENRLAGLGQDPIAARKLRIKDGTADFDDYIAEGDYKGAMKALLMMKQGESGPETEQN